MSIVTRLPAVLLALAIATPDIARDADDLTTQVRVKRVAMNAPADAERMSRLLKAAALEACGASSFSLAEYREAVARSGCYATALGRAQAHLAQAEPASSTTGTGGR
jgi:UrcA family protein